MCVAGAQGAQGCRDDGSGFAECICQDGGSAESGGAPAAGGSGGQASANGGDSSRGGGGGAAGTTGGAPPGAGGACVGINLIFILDRSGSMGASGQSLPGDLDRRWRAVVSAFTTYLGSVTSAALNASLMVFPVPCSLDLDAGGGCVCSAAEYNPATTSNRTVPLTEVVGHVATFTGLLNATDPNGGTPTIAALAGSYTYALSVQAAAPGALTYVVLITDGPPVFGVMAPDGGVTTDPGCTGNDFTTIAGLAQTSANQGIKTYVFGLGAVTNLGQVATAGGTQLVTINVASDAATSTQQLLAAFGDLPKPLCN